MICKILGFFVNTFNTDDKYSLLSRDNVKQPVQIQFSKKQKTYSQFFSEFLKSKLNFEHFFKKDNPHSLCISEIAEWERRGNRSV